MMDTDDTTGSEATETEETLASETQDNSADLAAETTETDEEPAPKPVKKSAQERINELTAARREAERDAEYWRSKALDNRTVEQPQVAEPVNEGRPDPAKFEAGEYDPAYVEALTDWKAEQAVSRALGARAQQTEQQQRATTFQAQIAAASAKHDDFEDKVLRGAQRGSWACTPDMLETMQESEMGAEVAYHLASNPAEAQRIASLSRASQAREIGKLEAKLSEPPKPTAKTLSSAPEPVASARGQAGRFTVAPDTSDFGAFDRQFGNG